MKHTPGPWIGKETISGPNGDAICDVVARNTWTTSQSVALIEANSSLIKLAPEMFELLKLASQTLAEVNNKTGMSFFSVGGAIDDLIKKVEAQK